MRPGRCDFSDCMAAASQLDIAKIKALRPEYILERIGTALPHSTPHSVGACIGGMQRMKVLITYHWGVP